MTNEVKSVPEIRFPEFDDEWKEKKFYECVEIEGKLVNPNFHEYQNLPHIGPGNIQKNTGRILNYNLVKDENLISGKFEFDEEDIIYGKINPQLQKICIPGFRGLASADTYPIKTISGVSNTYFIYYSLFTSRFFKYSVSVSMRTGMPKINKEELGSYNFYLPKIMEQQKIGGFFSKLDCQIELEEQKLEKLEEQKKGYMQKVFSQELRFKDENGNEYPEWEDKKLLNVIAIQNGYAFKSNLFSEKGMPIIRITDINKSTVKKGTVYYPESIEINERFKIKQYDILIAMSGATTGKVGKYISEKPSLLNQRIGKFVMKKGTDNNFMFTYLNSLYFKKELSKLLVAGAQPNISSQDIENINLFIPINEEQRKIGEFFNELDELIEKQSSKIGVLKQRKKGFLQKMFV